MLKVSKVSKTVRCKVLIQCMIAGDVKRPYDIVELKLSIANMLKSSGRVSIIRDSELTGEKPATKHKPEPALKVRKREYSKHNK